MAIGTTLDGAVEQSDFDGYAMPRMPGMAPVGVHIAPSDDPPAGVGEPALRPGPGQASGVTGERCRALRRDG